jgi:Flp pilus assembly protein TadG
MVEYLLVAPLVLLLIIATAEVGRGFLQYNTLTKTVRDGARYAAELATTSGGTTGVTNIDAPQRTAVQNLTAYGNTAGVGNSILPGLTAGDITVVGSASGGVVDVTATYAYTPIFSGLPMFGYGADIVPNFTFQVNVTMRAL